MNVEHLMAVGEALLTDIRQTNSLALLEQIRGSLQNQVNAPQDPAHQQRVSSTLETLSKQLSASVVDGFSPLWVQTVEQLTSIDLFGLRLRESLAEVFQRNQITPTLALNEVTDLHSRLAKARDAIEQATTGLKALGFRKDSLEPGEVELALLVPRDAVKQDLGLLAREFASTNATLRVFAELATGSRPTMIVRQIASSDYSLFVDLLPEVGACVAIAIERIVALYKTLLEVRKLRSELHETAGVPDGSLLGVDEHAARVMSDGIDRLVDDLLKNASSSLDDGRKNELKTELRLHLNRLANRIDQGYDVQVVAAPIDDDAVESPEEGTDGSDGDGPFARLAHLRAITEAASRTSFPERVGRPILQLPEPKDTRSDGEGS